MQFLLLFIVIFTGVLVLGHLKNNKPAKLIGIIGTLIPVLFLTVLIIGIRFLGWD